MKHNLYRCVVRKAAYFVLALGAVGLPACSNDGGDGPNADGRLKLQRLDIADAKYLTLAQAPARSRADEQPTLFKIDADGNLTAVVLTCTEETDGTTTRERTDLRAVPQGIHSLAGIYTLLYNCRFLDETGTQHPIARFYEPDAWDCHLLVRNSDGRIYYIPSAAHEYFTNVFHRQDLCLARSDSRGNLYLYSFDYGGSHVVSIATQADGNLAIKQINASALHEEAMYEQIWPMDNGTVILAGCNAECSKRADFILYPNGGFETLDLNPTEQQQTALFRTDGGIVALRIDSRAPGEAGGATAYTVSLHDFTVGTRLGDWSVASAARAELHSGTDYSTDPAAPDYLPWAAAFAQWGYDDYFNRASLLYETDERYIIGYDFLYDKRTGQLTATEQELRANMILPDSRNVFRGRAWNVLREERRADWFDFRSLASGSVSFEDPDSGGPIIWKGYSENIPGGEVVYTGNRQTDGKQVICTVRIDTGQAHLSVIDEERPITALVPLN